MAGLSDSVSNIIGTKIPYWLWAQFNERSEKGASNYRDAEVIKYITNKTAWVRMVSSIDIKGEDLDWFKTMNDQIRDGSDLAKQYVLFGGTSAYKDKTYLLRSGFSGLGSGPESNQAYGIMGKTEIQQFGYRPMPGIVNVSIETQGRLGSVRAATINFKCWDKAQLDVIDALYFKLGFSMFLEWGQTYYFHSEKPGKALSTELVSIDPFDKRYVNNKELMQLQIAKNNRETEGNYDAMLGMVTNFNFSFNQEGGYDCMVKLISLGVLGDAIKVNNSSKLVSVLEGKIKSFDVIINRLKIAEENRKKREIDKAVADALAKNATNIPNGTTGVPSPPQTLRQTKTFAVSESIASGRKNIKSDVVEFQSTNYLRLKDINRDLPVSNITNFKEIYLQIDTAAIKDTFFTANNSIGVSLFDALNDTTSAIYDPSIFAPNIPRSVLSAWFVNLYDENTWKKYGITFPTGRTIGKLSPMIASYNKLFTWYINPSDPKNPHQISFDIKSDSSDSTLPSGNEFLASNDPKIVALRDQIFKKLQIEKGEPDLTYSNNVTGHNKQTGEIETKDGKKVATTVKIYSADRIQIPSNAAPSTAAAQNRYEWSAQNRKQMWKSMLGVFVTSQTQQYWYEILKVQKISNQKLAVENIIGTNNSGAFIPLQDPIRNPITIYDTPRYLVTVDMGPVETDLTYIFEFENLIVRVGDVVNLYQDGKATEAIEVVPTRYKAEITFSELDLIKNFLLKDITEQQIQDLGPNPGAAATPPGPVQPQPQTVKTDNPLSYLSNLELSLRLIQVDSLVDAIKAAAVNQNDVIGLSRVVAKNYAKEKERTTLKQLFSNGIFTPILDALLDGSIDDAPLDDPESSTIKPIFDVYAKYGFATKLLSGQAQVSDLKPVDYVGKGRNNGLLTSYVLRYNVDQNIETGTTLNHPVYIPFGFLLMLINHSCTLYNPDAEFPTPIVYVDFNPNHNFCLTMPVHLSVDPLIAIIPMEGSRDQYKKSLFDPKVIDPNQYVIISPTKNGSTTKLFEPRSTAGGTGKDSVSGNIMQFIDEESVSNNENRGRIMNILISVDYLCNVIKRFAKKDGENKVFLKPLIDQILQDVNKSLGNLNIFRLSYNDAGNVFQITDDQIIPVPENTGKERQQFAEYEEAGSKSNTDLPLFGKKSVATSLDIKTEVSTRLSNMLAISANAPDKQGSKSTDATAFGLINYNYTDRYMSSRTEFETGSLVDMTGEIKAATEFNLAVVQTYSTDTLNDNRIATAINYYIDKLSKDKSKNKATRASAMIPVSLNFTTDGISGLYMGQSFTVDKNFLPYTYGIQKIYEKADLSYQNKVGFVVTGLSHTIESNTWRTSVKANMIFLKDRSDYGGALSVSSQGISSTSEVPTPNADKLIKDLEEIKKKNNNNLIIKDKNSIAYQADIDDRLPAPVIYIIEELFKKFPGIKLQGITGRSQFHMGLEGGSRHKAGKAADISIQDETDYYVPWQKDRIMNANGDMVGTVDKGHKNYDNYIKVHNFIKELAGDTRTEPVAKINVKSKKLLGYGITLFLDETIEGSKNATGPHWHFQIS